MEHVNTKNMDGHFLLTLHLWIKQNYTGAGNEGDVQKTADVEGVPNEILSTWLQIHLISAALSPLGPVNYINPCLGNLLCTFPITSDCDTTAFTQASTLFFFFLASHLRVDTHSCFLCRVSLDQWYRATWEPTGTDTTHPEVQTGSERQCFSSHLVPVTEVCRRSQQEQVPINLLIMQPCVPFSLSLVHFLSSLLSASLNHIPNKLLACNSRHRLCFGGNPE